MTSSFKRRVLVPHYARGTPVETAHDPLACVRYGGDEAGVEVAQGCVFMTLPGPSPVLYETWHPMQIGEQQAEGTASIIPRMAGKESGIGWSCEGDVLFAAFWVQDQPELCDAVQTHYERLITLSRQKGFPHIYRMWNYLGAINQDNEYGEERYRDFCRGRAQAFDALGVELTALPAATGIGLPAGGVAVYLIAHRVMQGVNVENPSQLPAYHYPPRYGRRSPSFARATVMEGESQTVLYLSGTASIRGHESVGHTLDEQLAITIETIHSLRAAAEKRFPCLQAGRFESMKLYVRHPKDVSAVQAAIERAFPCPAGQAPLLVADICRAELLVEVEGILLARH
ncbi:MAG: hypothetical protein M3036_11125 [Bifidobacteriales bacterium]|nr:hypothetical protein [Bifidobacteriales bacterium]